MGFLPPQAQIAMIAANLARKHAAKVLHSNNPDLLTQDLSNAMKEQKKILSDPDKNSIMTAYDVLPVILEVKILSGVVASKLGIETKGKSTIAVLEEIIQKSDERNGGKYAKGIKDTLEWTRTLFANPEIQDILKMEMTEIQKPTSLKGIGKMFMQVAGRGQDELTRLNEFLKRAKDVAEKQPEDKPAPKADAKPEDKAQPQVKDTDKAPEAPKPPKPPAPGA